MGAAFQTDAFQNDAFQTEIIITIVSGGYDYALSWVGEILEFTMLRDTTTVTEMQMLEFKI